MVSVYTGLSIPALNEVLKNPLPETAYIGDHTFVPLYSTLQTLGLPVPVLTRHAEFMELASGYRGNVYTALYRYLRDFGYLGMPMMMCFLGAGYQMFFQVARKSQGFLLILYGVFFYPVPMLPIDDLFFSDVLSTESVYLLIYLSLLYYFILYQNQVPEVKRSEEKQ